MDYKKISHSPIHKKDFIGRKRPIFKVLKNKYFLNKMVKEVNQSLNKPS